MKLGGKNKSQIHKSFKRYLSFSTAKKKLNSMNSNIKNIKANLI